MKAQWLSVGHDEAEAAKRSVDNRSAREDARERNRLALLEMELWSACEEEERNQELSFGVDAASERAELSEAIGGLSLSRNGARL